MTEMKARLVDKDGNPLGTAANPLKISGDVGGGVPDGGTTGQVLKKKSNTDQDTEWGDGSGAATSWGSIVGTLADQTDLNTALNGKASKTESDLTFYVYEDATGTGDGSSKANGFTSLQAAIDAIPDVAQNVTVIVSKGSTNYLGDTTFIQKASVKSLTIRGEYYAYEACDANAVAGKVVDASADFSDFEVGDRVVCTHYSGTLGASSIDDYFYATITEVGSGYVQTSESTKVPTTGWRYLINQTVFDGDNGSNNIILNDLRDNLRINGICAYNTIGYGYNNRYNAYSRISNCIIDNCKSGTYFNYNTRGYIDGSAYCNVPSKGVGIVASGSDNQITNTIVVGNTTSGTVGIDVSASTYCIYLGVFNVGKATQLYYARVNEHINSCYIDSSCTYGAYGYNITLSNCTNNATTPVYNLTSGGSIEEWDGQALPDVSAASAFDVLRLNSDKSAFEFSTIPTVWSEVTSTSQAAAADNGYIANNASLVTITLPSTCAVGKIVEVAGSGAGGWKIAQNAGQKIVFGSVETTEGVTGNMYSNSRYEAVKLICITANTTFSVLRATGNPELV